MSLGALAFEERNRRSLGVAALFGLVRARGGLLLGMVVAQRVLQAIVIGGFALVAKLVAVGLENSVNIALRHGLAAAVVLVGLVVATLVGIFFDLSRAAAIIGEQPFLAAMGSAGRSARALGVALVASWLWRSAAGLAAVAAGALLADQIGGKDGSLLVALVVTHQAIVLFRILLGTSWLAQTLRSVDRHVRTRAL
jgi:hypothetical protein